MTDTMELWHCLCLPFGEMAPSRSLWYFSVAVILLHWVIFQTYFKFPFLSVRPCTLFISLPLCIMNSDLHAKSCFIFVKLVHQNNKMKPFIFTFRFPRTWCLWEKEAPLQHREKENKLCTHWTRKCYYVYFYKTFVCHKINGIANGWENNQKVLW